MSRRKWYAAAAVVIVAAVALGLVLGLTGGGQKQSTESSQASLASAGVPSEGIQVHGHWTIDVKNPDGSLASHYEFENAFQSGGGGTLASVLAGLITPGTWMVRMNASSASYSLRVYEPGCSLDPQAGDFRTLTKAAVGTGGSVLELHGTAQAIGTTNFTSVQTSMYSCDNTFSPSGCGCKGAGPTTITLTTLPQPIPVQIGQPIVVTVDITFS
jgi:hypothetical protein